WIPITVGFPELAVFEKLAKQCCGARLTLLSSRFVNARIEWSGRPEQSFEGHCARNVRRLPNGSRVSDSKRGNRSVSLRPVYESDPFLRSELHRFEPDFAKHLERGT